MWPVANRRYRRQIGTQTVLPMTTPQCWKPLLHTGASGAHHGFGGGGGTSGGANNGAYGGGGVYHAGGAGGGLHTMVAGFHDMLEPQSAELTPAVATAAAIDTNATATTAARRRPNHLMPGLPKGPSRP